MYAPTKNKTLKRGKKTTCDLFADVDQREITLVFSKGR